MKVKPYHHFPSFLFFVAFLFIYNTSFSQTRIRFQQFTTDQRLSENVVYCLLQDQRGFIWAGTHHGLNRYDGYNFKKYYAANNDTSSLSDNTINCMVNDGSGKLWIGTRQGLNHFDPVTGKNRRIQRPGAGLNYEVMNIYPLNQNELLLHLGNEICLFRIKTNQWIKTKTPAGLMSNFYTLPDGRIGTGSVTEGGFLLYDKKDQAWYHHGNLKGYPVNARTIVSNYFSDSKGNHYLYSIGHSFDIFNAKGKRIAGYDSDFLKDDFAPFSIKYTESDGITWLATNKGLLQFDLATEKLSQVEMTGNKPSVKGNKELRSLLLDKDQDLWLGGFGEGILKCRIGRSPFFSIGLEEITEKSVGRMIFGLYEWTGGEIVAETGYSNFSVIRKNEKMHFTSSKELGLEKIIFHTLGKRKEDIPPIQLKILNRLFQENLLYPKQFFLHDSTSVVCTVGRFSIHTETVSKAIGDYATQLCDEGGYYWVATLKGLLRVNKKNFTDTTYLNDPSDPYSLNENSLYAVTGDGNGNLWIGTKGGGLNFFDSKQQKFFHYTMENGLPDNVVYFIVPYHQGNLWLSTNNGLSRFNVKSRSFQNFSKRDGLLNSEFNRNGGLLSSDGYMYFSGTNGIDYFRPSEVVGIKNEVASFISEIRVNGKERAAHDPVLGHSQNNITISFTANDFSRPDLVYYRYSLNGDEWTRVQGTNSVSYHGLSHGNYTFKVASSYDNFNWSQPALYQFTIATPWWKSFWFYLACATATIIAIWLIYRYRINQYKKIQLMRTRISQDLHDEVGATLSSIHVYSSVASRTLTKDAVKAEDALKQINLNTRQVMENMNDIVWALNTRSPGETTLETKLKNYSYELLAPMNIICSYHVDKEAERNLNHIGARKNILLVAKEAINNIARHSGATKAAVRLEVVGKSLVLEVSDNGKGRDADNGKNGNGLRNMKSRINALGGKFHFESRPGMGTQIRCIIPLANIRD